MGTGGSHLSKNNKSSRSSASRHSEEEAVIKRSEQSSAPRRTAEEPAPRRTERAPAPRRTAEEPAPRRTERAPAPPPAERPPRSAGKRRGKKRRSKGSMPLWPVILILVLGMCFALFMLGRTLLSYFRNRSSYDALRDIAVVQLTPAPTTAAAEGSASEEIVQSEIPLSIDWEKLQATNSDIIGWLYCPDTIISYPVVRTTDNETYLTTNFEGEYNVGGSLFADYGSSVGFLSSHLIIYGHNMKDNSMFGTLKSYADPDYYAEHPIFYFLTPTQSYRVELLEAATISAELENYPTYFGSGETAASYIGRLSQNVYWFNDAADYNSYQLLTMSTCTSSDDDRLIVQGVMVPIQ